MQKAHYVLVLTLTLGFLTSCDELAPTAPKPCASAIGDEWEFLGLRDDTLGYVRAVAVDPANPARILATTSNDSGEAFSHLFLSEDDGASWQVVLASERNIKDIVFELENPNNAFYGSSDGVYRSTDGGVSWIFTSREICTGLYTSVLFLRRSVSGVLYAGTGGSNADCPITMYRSEDDGLSWVDLCQGQSGCLPGGPYQLAIDPSNSRRLLAGLQFTSGMQESTDSGDTWTTNGYTQPGRATGIVVDVEDPNTIYVGHAMGGASRSTDGGKTWATYDTGLSPETVGGEMAQEQDTRTLFLRGLEDNYGTLWRRDIASSSWNPMGIPGEDLHWDGALSLTADHILYVGSYGLWRRDLTVIPSNEPGPCGA